MVEPPRRILTVCTRRIGDVLLLTPLIHSLRRAWPGARMDVLVFAGTAGVLEGNPDIDRVLTVPQRPTLGEHLSLYLRIMRRYDLALATIASDRAHFYTLAAASRRVSVVPPPGRNPDWKRWLSTAWTELDDRDTHTVEQYLRLADALAIPRASDLVPPADPAAGRHLADLLPFPLAGVPFVVLHPTPKWHYKRWHPAGWRGLAEHLQRRGLRVVVTGGPDPQERAYLASILADAPPGVVNLAGALTLAQTAELMRHARLYVGPDTAVTHMAAGCGIPVVALYGPTNPVKWAPWPQGYRGRTPPFARSAPVQTTGNVTLVQGEADCVPCHEEGCERRLDSYSRCLDELGVWRVTAVADEILGRAGGLPVQPDPPAPAGDDSESPCSDVW